MLEVQVGSEGLELQPPPPLAVEAAVARLVGVVHPLGLAPVVAVAVGLVAVAVDFAFVLVQHVVALLFELW
jgi:hypothetical protein